MECTGANAHSPSSNSIAVLQCVNAMKRVTATYVDKSDAVIGEGGAATFLDLSRVIFGMKLDLDVGNAVDPGRLPYTYALEKAQQIQNKLLQRCKYQQHASSEM